MTTHSTRPSELARLATLVTFGASGVTMFLAMPILAASLVNIKGHTDADAALFSSVQLIAVSVGCLVSVWLPVRNLRRFALLCLSLLLACDLICLTDPAWNVFLIVRAIGGVAGGLAVSQATAAMSRLSNPERTFGLFLAWQTIVSILFAYVASSIMGRYGFGTGFSVAALLDVLGLGLASIVLGHGAAGQADDSTASNDLTAWVQSGLVLISIFMFFVGIGAVWTFLVLMAERVGIATSQVGNLITVSKVCAFFGSFLPGFAQKRFGHYFPVVIAALCLVSGVAFLAISRSFLPFALATAVLSTAWYAYYPTQLSALSYLDRDGRPMLASAALTGVGLGLGPMVVTGWSSASSMPHSVASTAGPAFAISGMGMVIAYRLRSPGRTLRMNRLNGGRTTGIEPR